MNKNIPFLSLSDIGKNLKNRKIIIFGAGNIAEKTYRILDKKKLEFIVDNSSNLWGNIQSGLKVYDPLRIKNENEKYYVIICTTSFSEVSEQLIKYGFILKDDFAVSPILNDLRSIYELENINKKIIFSSGSQK